jgi:hypothetical protein
MGRSNTLSCNSCQSSKKMFHDIIFPRFGVPKVVISNGGSHFIDGNFRRYLKAQGVEHRIATLYHPQTSGQVEITNKKIKNILSEDCPRHGKRVERETSRSIVGISYDLQNSHRYDTLPIGLWEDMPSTCRIGVQITLG